MDRLRRSLPAARAMSARFAPTMSAQLLTATIGLLPALLLAAIGTLLLALTYDASDNNSGLRVFIRNTSYSLIAAAIVVFLTFLTFAVLSVVFNRSRARARNFLRFFGQVCEETGRVFLVFASRERRESDFVTLPSDREILPKDVRPKGISDWIPVQDLRGALYMSAEIARQTSVTAVFRTDRDLQGTPMDQLQPTVISFGLGFNFFTYELIGCTEKKLFDVNFEEQLARDGGLRTDNIWLPGFGVLEPPEGKEYAIVARIVHGESRTPSRFFFICAGRTANGTAVAGNYLAAHWEDMMQRYTPDRLNTHSLLLVLSFSSTPGYGETDFGQVAQRDSKDLIRWYPTIEERPSSN